MAEATLNIPALMPRLIFVALSAIVAARAHGQSAPGTPVWEVSSIPPLGYESRGGDALSSALLDVAGPIWIFGGEQRNWFALRESPPASNAFTLNINADFRQASISWQLVGGDYSRAEGRDAQSERLNLFFGSNPALWRKDIPVFRGVHYSDVYPGIDLEIGAEGTDYFMEIQVAAGRDPDQIRLELAGSRAGGIDRNEIIETWNGTNARLTSFEVSQSGVPLSYELVEDGYTRIRIPSFDRTKRLIIRRKLPKYVVRRDPSKPSDSSTLKSNGSRVSTDAAGNISVAVLSSMTRPINETLLFDPLEFRQWVGEPEEAVVTKYDKNGRKQYTTVVGGFNDEMLMTTTPRGEVILAGRGAPLAPVDESQIPPWASNSGSPLLLVRLDAEGHLVASHLTKVGALELADLVVDDRGRAHLAMTSYGDAPKTGRSFTLEGASSHNALLLTVDLSKKKLPVVYAAAIGGERAENSVAVAASRDGTVYLAASTESFRVATTAGAFRPKRSERPLDGLIARLDPGSDGAASLLALTYFGGTGAIQYPNDEIRDLAVDADGSLWVAGSTVSPYFPITRDAFASSLTASRDGFVSQLSPSLDKLEYSTRFGGGGDDWIDGLVRTKDGLLAITGRTTSADLPRMNQLVAHDPEVAGLHGFVALFEAGGKHLLASSLAWRLPDDPYARMSVAWTLDAKGNWILSGASPLVGFAGWVRGIRYALYPSNTLVRIAPCAECRHVVDAVSDQRQAAAGVIRIRGRLGKVAEVSVNGEVRKVVERSDEMIAITVPATEEVRGIELVMRDARRVPVVARFGSTTAPELPPYKPRGVGPAAAAEGLLVVTLAVLIVRRRYDQSRQVATPAPSLKTPGVGTDSFVAVRREPAPARPMKSYDLVPEQRPAPATVESTTCPRCATPREPNQLECCNCGVVFGRYRTRPIRPSAEMPTKVDAAPPAAPELAAPEATASEPAPLQPSEMPAAAPVPVVATDPAALWRGTALVGVIVLVLYSMALSMFNLLMALPFAIVWAVLRVVAPHRRGIPNFAAAMQFTLALCYLPFHVDYGLQVNGWRILYTLALLSTIAVMLLRPSVNAAVTLLAFHAYRAFEIGREFLYFVRGWGFDLESTGARYILALFGFCGAQMILVALAVFVEPSAREAALRLFARARTLIRGELEKVKP